MKVGIITKIGKNYGAVLQAYALKKKFSDMGADAHIIRYTPSNSVKTYKTCKYSWGPKGTIANAKAAVHFSEYKRATQRFYKFRDTEYDFLGNYCNDDDLEANPPACDIYVTGSDQVWNPLLSFDRAYYCMFADLYPNVRTAAYAASIGLKEIPSEFSAEFASRIKKMNYVSVRENHAIEILADMGITAEAAPDPTLLLCRDEWQSLAVKTEAAPYILCYFVSFPDGIQNVVEKFKKQLGMKVVNLMTSEESSMIGDVKIRDAGPREFLGLFDNASFVITSSFHGSVFSLINKKPFVVTLYKNTSSRVTELLDSFKCSDHIITPDCVDITPYLNVNADMDRRNTILDATRERGEKIIKTIMEVR